MAKRKSVRRQKKRKGASRPKKTAWILFLLCSLLFLIAYSNFKSWKNKHLSRIESSSESVFTTLGSIEYMSIGEGPVVLLSHMGGAGFDNALLFQKIADAGFRIICPSRPGYLNTPLNNDADFRYQAGLFAELLQHLNIKEKVFVMGISAGAPAAIEFVNQYPSLCKGLILHSAIGGNFSTQQLKENNPLLTKILSSNARQDICGWLFSLALRITPRNAVEHLLKITTKYSLQERKDMAVAFVANKGSKDQIKLLHTIVSPPGKRSKGLQNDLKYLQTYTPKSYFKRIPLLLTHSSKDKIVDVAYTKNLANKNPQAELYIYEGYGHAFLPGQDGGQVISKTINFLKKHNGKINTKQVYFSDNLLQATWVNTMDGALLSIESNGRFTLDFPSVDKQEIVSGKVIIENDNIRFINDQDSKFCKSTEGLYQFKVNDNKLALKPVNDKCNIRKSHFSEGWFKL